jgi:hypothetical protein
MGLFTSGMIEYSDDTMVGLPNKNSYFARNINDNIILTKFKLNAKVKLPEANWMAKVFSNGAGSIKRKQSILTCEPRIGNHWVVEVTYSKLDSNFELQSGVDRMMNKVVNTTLWTNVRTKTNDAGTQKGDGTHFQVTFSGEYLSQEYAGFVYAIDDHMWILKTTGPVPDYISEAFFSSFTPVKPLPKKAK